jgi:AcrR family transcriptional regulator
MSPRPYQLGQRQAAANETRARILAAAKDLLTSSAGISGFSMEAVAKQADVARMTVYHQFGSRTGLLESLCDSLAVYGGMEQLANAFRRPNPLEALDAFVAVFGHFWESDRLALRRLRGLAALDPDFEQVIRARDERRRTGMRVLVGRLSQQLGRPPQEAAEETVDILFTLSSFECFDALAGPSRSMEEVTPVVQRLARAALEISRGPEVS